MPLLAHLFRFFLGAFLVSFGKKVLLGLGLGIVTSVALNTVLNYYIDKLIAILPKLGQHAVALMGVAGLDVALSITIGAYVVRFSLKAMGVSFRKISS